MKLLFVVENANLRGGTEILTFHLLSALRAVGENVYVLSIVPYVGKEPYVISLDEDEYVRWKTTSLSLSNKFLFSIPSDRILRKILTDKLCEYDPCLLVSQTYDLITALPIECNVAQVFNWSIVGYEESLGQIINKKRILARICSKVYEWGKRVRRHLMLSKIPKLIILTESAKGELKTLNSNVRNEQMVVIPDLLMFDKDSDLHSSLMNSNVSFVGRLSHEKGVMRLLRIWERVSFEMPDLKLSIYGIGEARKEMDQYIYEHNLRNVHFYGFCKDQEQIYATSDLLLMTSDTEGFGMVLIEAMYYGVPCVSFDCPVSPKEIISDAGILVPSFDEEAFADSIVKLLQNPKQMKECQERAIQRAKDFYMNKVIMKWERLLESSVIDCE